MRRGVLCTARALSLKDVNAWAGVCAFYLEGNVDYKYTLSFDDKDEVPVFCVFCGAVLMQGGEDN